jgi:hypothetical protein
MSEPFLERLSQFTPDSSKLDRDALLFAAGHGSARPNRLWKAFVAILVVTQVSTLVLLWSPAPSPALSHTPPGQSEPVSPGAGESVPSESFASPGLWSARQGLLEAEPENRPAEPGTLMDSGPPLRAFPLRPSSF